MDWRKDSREATHWHFDLDKNKTECELCPRNCSLKEGQMGFCLVRGNVKNAMHTYNYGRSVQATEECIETEAVNHYMPGAKILSMGNVGCMMACSYCQNWQTSQIKHLNSDNVKIYTPQEVIDIALSNNIEVISWTYNDPVVWQEFVVDTSRLAKKHGITTLYKSALYIEAAPLKELIEVIDIFSISLKSMNEEVYKKITKGELKPVLRGIKQIAQSGKHLEISQLVVTELNDDGIDARKTAIWMRENVNPDVPLHLVAYHPAFRYDKPRTSIETLFKLRDIVLEEGIKYCYLGNVYSDNVSNTFCKKCNHKLVERFGLTVHVVGLNNTGNCTNCGEISPIKRPLDGQRNSVKDYSTFSENQKFEYEWNREVNSLHVVMEDVDKRDVLLRINRFPKNNIEYIEMNHGLERVIISRSGQTDERIIISADTARKIHFLPVLDRAHFPVVEDATHEKKYLN